MEGQVKNFTFTDEQIIKKNNGYYQFARNGMMFGVSDTDNLTDEEQQLYQDLMIYIKNNPDKVTVEQPYVPTVLTLDEVKANKIAEINKTYEQYAKQAQIDTPDSEVITWDIQKTEAEAWQKDNTVATPFIDMLALGRNVDRVYLLGKVLEKTQAYQNYIGYLTGMRQGCEDRVKIATTTAEVQAVVFVLPDSLSLG